MKDAGQGSQTDVQEEGKKVIVSGGNVSLSQTINILAENGLVSEDYTSRVKSGWSDGKMQELAASATGGLPRGIYHDNSGSKPVAPSFSPGSVPASNARGG